MKKVTLKPETIQLLQDDEAIARLFLEIKEEVKTLDTLKRWLRTGDIKLTYYGVLLAISEILNKEIESLIEEK